MKKYIILSLVILFSEATIARHYGETKLLKNGSPLYMHGEGTLPHAKVFLITKSDVPTMLHELDRSYNATKDLDYLSDKGLVLIVAGRYSEAIDLYLEIEKMEPNRYSTASNIGTAYELIGENEKALQWIKRAVAIDPASHDNSEWIHINILEAKINGEKYNNTKHLLNTDFGTEKKPVSKLNEEELLNLQKALLFQLNERMSFSKLKDKIMGQLLFDLGNVTFLLGDFLVATKHYELAVDYGFDEKVAGDRHVQSVHRVLKAREPFLDFRTSMALVCLGAAVILLVYYIKNREALSAEVD